MGTEDGLHSDLTRKIIGAALRVRRSLGYGFLEHVYSNALIIELREMGLEVLPEAPIQVRYRGQIVGAFQADLLVDGRVIVELKAVEALIEVHEVQLVNYLKATDIGVGLLINFGTKFEVKRRIYTNDRKLLA